VDYNFAAFTNGGATRGLRSIGLGVVRRSYAGGAFSARGPARFMGHYVNSFRHRWSSDSFGQHALMQWIPDLSHNVNSWPRRYVCIKHNMFTRLTLLRGQRKQN